MQKQDIPKISEDQEKNDVSILISGTGNIYIKKEAESSFKINSDKSPASSMAQENFESEEKARNKVNQLVYKQLATRLEKSIRTENLVLLTGAGSSKECGGPSMADLWKKTSEDTTITSDWKKLLESAGYKPETGKENLEELLSNLQTINNAHEINKNKGDDFSGIIKKIEGIILRECKKVDIKNESSHVRFLKRILKGRSTSSSRLKVFTLNYDTAFEQAGEKIGAVVIDGFLFSFNKIFKSTEFDLDIVQRERSRIHYEENFYDKVFQLYKLHGSIDWKSDKTTGIISKDSTTVEPVLVYPNSSKFEKSFEMPFFEMVSRLQTVLRKENTTLFIVGYGFGDRHINRIISESIKNNLNLEIFVIKPTLDNLKMNEYIEDINKGSMNIHLIGNTFEEFSSGLPDVQIGGLFSDDENNGSKYEKKSIRSQ